MPRSPLPPLSSAVAQCSSVTKCVNNDGGCPPVDTPCARLSCSSMTHRLSAFTHSKFCPSQY
eukprot:2119312-Pleurochrysis_carterae.AAC.1